MKPSLDFGEHPIKYDLDHSLDCCCPNPMERILLTPWCSRKMRGKCTNGKNTMIVLLIGGHDTINPTNYSSAAAASCHDKGLLVDLVAVLICQLGAT